MRDELRYLTKSSAARPLRVDGRRRLAAPATVEDVLLLLALAPGVEAGEEADVAMLHGLIYKYLPLRAASALTCRLADPMKGLLELLSLASDGVEPAPQRAMDDVSSDAEESAAEESAEKKLGMVQQMLDTRWDLLLEEYAATRGASVCQVLAMPFARFLYFFARLDVYVARHTLRYSRLHILHAASEPQTLFDELHAEAQYDEQNAQQDAGQKAQQDAERDGDRKREQDYEIKKGRLLAAFMTARSAEERARLNREYWQQVYAQRGLTKSTSEGGG